MRNATVKIDGFTGRALVSCTVGHTLQAEFRCFDASGADMVAHTFTHVGAAAAGEVYRTIYADQLTRISSECTCYSAMHCTCNAATVH